MSIGERILTLRGSQSRKIFGKRIGIVENTLRNYEQGQSLPNSDVIAKICSELNVNFEWLLTGTGPMHRDGRAEQPQEDTQHERVRELERQLAETKEELIRAYRLAATAMQPIAEDIQEIKRAINAPAHNKRIDEKEDQIKQVGK